ncbi:hypothetical protein MJO28_000209 [Puccinia striiformis f. sp. tritici]|uniref:Uncharacterized protein n=2 Tax=Puccinia striiformis f. sp. tritici TaxID=168172 RepID=A0A0L0VM13_9BASI|nr:hypothetical protein Pst134EB_002221 [Puccinia striiformis f. sp. tritici]KAI7962115.1 hypothetical protein MJO28_000209 [Puccinia striiformis f. sp. tritici]KAI7967741.1 hypothetical protein MJO29_001018 [Puccinia striiformis f. sp. tritici]KAI9600023.1 hypothetical protein KEM48_000237 [Puccinia striiformis f. sp. tritici PST-130]KNF00262.1 hypothetical protein PSTG_06434 [Puccinia striiformis f. sp. tritici PST-78]
MMEENESTTRPVEQTADDMLSPTVPPETLANPQNSPPRPSADVPPNRDPQLSSIADETANNSTSINGTAGPVRNRVTTAASAFSPYGRPLPQLDTSAEDILHSTLVANGVRAQETMATLTSQARTLRDLIGHFGASPDMDLPDSSLSAAGTGTSADVNMQASSTAGTAGAGLLASSGAPADRNSRLRQLQTSLGIRDDVFAQAEPLFDIPEAERWPVLVLLLLSAVRQSPRTSTPLERLMMPAQPNYPPQPHRYSSAFKTFVRGNLGQILLRGDLERYGRPVGRAADRAYISKAPLPIMRKIIDDQPETVRANYLPSDYSTSITAVPELLKLIREILKNEKNTFADAILNGSQPISPGNYRPMPTLDQLVIHLFREMDFTMKLKSDAEIHSDSKLTHQVRVRIAYLRFQLNVHRRQHRQPGFWETIDRDLGERRSKSPAYKAAFAHLILQKDRQLWNGTNRIIDVPDDTQGVPTEPEILAHVQRIEEQSGLNRPRA